MFSFNYIPCWSWKICTSNGDRIIYLWRGEISSTERNRYKNQDDPLNRTYILECFYLNRLLRLYLIAILGLVLNTAGGILYSFVKYREGLLDRRKKDYLKAKENDTNCDMNQNSTKTGEHRLSLASVESEYSDSNRDKHRIALSAISAV